MVKIKQNSFLYVYVYIYIYVYVFVLLYVYVYSRLEENHDHLVPKNNYDTLSVGRNWKYNIYILYIIYLHSGGYPTRLLSMHVNHVSHWNS